MFENVYYVFKGYQITCSVELSDGKEAKVGFHLNVNAREKMIKVNNRL